MPRDALFAVDPGTPPSGRSAGGVPGAKADPLALLVPAGLLALVLIAGAVALVVADRWRKRDRGGADAAESLTDFRGMYERGEITEAEYKKLRDKMAARIKTGTPGGLPRPGSGAGSGAAPPAADPPVPPPGEADPP